MRRFTSVAHSILDILLPRSARRKRAESLSARDIQIQPKSLEGAPPIACLLDYRQRNVADLIRAAKYDSSGGAAQILADILGEYLREEIAHAKLFWARDIYIAPIPLHPSRERERGFNQVEKILGKLPEDVRGHVRTNLISRTRDTKTQTLLSKEERARNVARAFRAEGKNLAHAYILLVDDVATTGSTLRSAGSALSEAGAEIALIALARA